MSYAATQRIVVRMLYDAAFRQSVYAAPCTALAGIDLTPEERATLVQPDPRAYGTDPYRRSRALHGLLEEYAVSAWLAGCALGDVRRLDKFFSSPFFHNCIQQRGSLAQSFGAYLDRGSRSGEIRDTRVAWTAALEGATASLRRRWVPRAESLDATARPGAVMADHTIPEHALFEVSARYAIVTVAGGTGQLYQEVRAHLASLGSDIVESLMVDDVARAPAALTHLQVDDAEALLLERLSDPGAEITIEAAHAGLAALLAMAAHGATAQALWAEAAHHGASAGEAREIVAELVTDGLLVPRVG